MAFCYFGFSLTTKINLWSDKHTGEYISYDFETPLSGLQRVIFQRFQNQIHSKSSHKGQQDLTNKSKSPNKKNGYPDSIANRIIS